MKRFLLFLLFLISLNTFSQIKFRYGITAGMNVSTALLPELKLNTDIRSILEGEDDVVQGDPQLADFIAMYKGGLFMRLDGGVGSLKLNVVYDKTNIHENLDANIFSANVLDITLGYLNFEMSANLNLFKHFYISVGYIPALLIEHQGNLNINDFDPRILTGFGIRIGESVTIDLNTIIGMNEIIDGSYIHNVIIPVTVNIPFN